MFDVTIVGARCAGASLAIFLAQKGYDICLIDRNEFPSDTLSTHVFGDWGLYKKLGVDEKIKAAGAPQMKRFKIDMEGCQFEGPIMVTSSVCGLRRIKLDEILLEEAKCYSNITWRSGCKMVDLLQEDGEISGIQVIENGKRSKILSKVIIGADGRHSSVAKKVQASSYKKFPSTRCAYYTYIGGITPAPSPTFEFYWSGDDILLIFPCDEKTHCVVIMPPQTEFHKWKKRPDYLLERIKQIHSLHPRLTRAKMLEPVRGTAMLDSYLREAYGERWALVGDAGGAVHPCAGSGIDQAVACAEILSEDLQTFFNEEKQWKEALDHYKEARDELIEGNMMNAINLAQLPAFKPEIVNWISLVCSLPSLAHKVVNHLPELMRSIIGDDMFDRMEELCHSLPSQEEIKAD